MFESESASAGYNVQSTEYNVQGTDCNVQSRCNAQSQVQGAARSVRQLCTLYLVLCTLC
jgi:hypothetical protein